MKFDSFYGNDTLLSAVAHAVDNNSFPSACLIGGVEGTGKFTLAKLIASALLCSGADRPCQKCSHCIKTASLSHPDMTVIDMGDKEIKVDTVREIRAEVYVRPNEANCKAVIIRHAENLNTAAQNAFLKVLEEPPANVFFILVTENMYALLETVRSRCLKLSVSPLSDEEMDSALKNHGIDANKRKELTKMSRGSLGTALSLLENDEMQTAFAEGKARAKEFAEGMCEGTEFALARVTVSLEKLKKQEMTAFLNSLRSILRDALVISCGAPSLCDESEDTANKLSTRISREGLLKMSDLVAQCEELTDINVGTPHLLSILSAGYFNV